MAVIFRDPRDVVISERRMRVGIDRFQKQLVSELDDFIWERYETIVAWMHQRWVWHTTAYSSSSHVVFYDELKASSGPWIDLARFIGLECSTAQALETWNSLQCAKEPGRFTSYGLPDSTLDMMNATMASLLPEAMLLHWGLAMPDV